MPAPIPCDHDKRGCSACRGARKITRTRMWREINAEKERVRKRSWRQANPEKHRERERKWREQNPEAAKARQSKWRQNNIEKHKANSRTWYENNPEKHRVFSQGMRWPPGVTFEALCNEQNNKCAICGEQLYAGTGNHAVDHCHITGCVRGLLCINCNSGVGKLHDDVRLLARAIAYLNHHAERIAQLDAESACTDVTQTTD